MEFREVVELKCDTCGVIETVADLRFGWKFKTPPDNPMRAIPICPECVGAAGISRL